jgi:hypothetical protein
LQKERQRAQPRSSPLRTRRPAGFGQQLEGEVFVVTLSTMSLSAGETGEGLCFTPAAQRIKCITRHMSHVTRRTSYVTHLTSVTSQITHVTHHVSSVTHNTSRYKSPVRVPTGVRQIPRALLFFPISLRHLHITNCTAAAAANHEPADAEPDELGATAPLLVALRKHASRHVARHHKPHESQHKMRVTRRTSHVTLQARHLPEIP